MPVRTTIVLVIAGLGLGGVAGFFGYKRTLTEKAIKFKERIAKVKDIEEELLLEAKKKCDDLITQAEKKAEKIEEQRLAKMEEIQNRLLDREEKMEQRLEKLEEEKGKVVQLRQQADDVVKQQLQKLSEIAELTPKQAKEEIFAMIEKDNVAEINRFVEKYKTIKAEEAETEAAKIVVNSLQKIATQTISEFTTKTVDLPSEDIKGKLIGREGRNISFFEKTTGVELIIDDTPGTVKISSFDNAKRFIAARTLELLIKDGRINPMYIEKVYNQVVEDLQNTFMEKGKEALSILNIPMMKPEIVKTIGQFFLRFSYGQSLRSHSVEVAKIAEAIAVELGLDPVMAKKAGLLHDIGKVLSTTGESHTKLGADMLRKRGMDPIIINAAESHHYEVAMTNPISRIIAAADAMSASRPGARFDTKELFIEKMGELEKLINEVEGVDKVHIMQAGREIMVYVNPKQIGDMEVETLLKEI
ncbi:MAG: Rnase Y domain-containing protein [Candidatus Peribacteria bacterium]|nr:Rnase Y domain-containing protein [Candidatus Peribacteria bacterium]